MDKKQLRLTNTLQAAYIADLEEALRLRMVNQCDGCCAGMAMRGNLHIDLHGHAVMSCQREKYLAPCLNTKKEQP